MLPLVAASFFKLNPDPKTKLTLVNLDSVFLAISGYAASATGRGSLCKILS
jgi:hypothetical protein